MKWWMTALTVVSVAGVLLLPGVRRKQAPLDDRVIAARETAENPSALPIKVLEPARLEANENLVVVSRNAAPKEKEIAKPEPVAAASVSTSTSAAPASAAEPATVEVRPVTITGCLEADHDHLLLKETSGAAVPKARSWKSGFLSKRSASIELVEPTHVLKLASYDGQRISVSGTLDDREMHVHSVQRVDPSCH